MTEKKFICIYTLIPWDFPLDYFREYAVSLSRYANVVYLNIDQPVINTYKDLKNKHIRNFFFASVRSYMKPLTIFVPFRIFPGERFYIIKRINRLCMKILLWGLFFIKSWHRCSFRYQYFPMPHNCLPIYHHFSYLIFDCMDISFDADNKRRAEFWKKEHNKLVRAADAVLVNSTFYKTLCRTKKIYMVSQGVSLKKNFSRKNIVNVLPDIPRPIVGFSGYTYPRLDVGLLIYAAKQLPHVSFVFVGPLKNDVLGLSMTEQKIIKEFYQTWPNLKKLPNVYHLGDIPNEIRRHYIAQFTVGIIPYNTRIRYVKYGNATKAYEYLAMGEPVVSTELKPLHDLDDVIRFAKNKEQFVRQIKMALKDSMDGVLKKKYISRAMYHDVSHKAYLVNSILTNLG